MVKITDVADKAGVAKSTVSNVLTGKKFVSEELKQKVLAACKELDFQPNFYAAGLSSKKTNIIALLLEATPEINSYPFYKDLIMACLRGAAEQGYSLLVYYEDDDEKLLRTLRQGRSPIDGAILLTPSIDDGRLAEMESSRTNCVVIGRPTVDDIRYVDIDNSGLVREAVGKLVADYGKNVYLFNSNSRLTISQDRTATFLELCGEYGIDGAGRVFESVDSTEADGYEFAKNLVTRGAVFVTANEALAKGVYRAAEEKGMKIGGDVAVFALGRSVQHGKFTPKLSYAWQDYEELGKHAVDMLISEINGETAESHLIKSHIEYRDSTQK